MDMPVQEQNQRTKNGPQPPTPFSNSSPVPGTTPLPVSYRLKPEGPLPQPKPPTTPTPGTPGTPAPAQTTPLNISAQDDPRLTALGDRYNRYLDDFESGHGAAMDLAGSRFRDAREGARASMMNDAAFRGVGPDMRGFTAETLRGQQAAIADVAAQREAQMGENLRGGLAIAAAPGQQNLNERQFGLQTWQAQQNAAQQAYDNQRAQAQDSFAQFLALLNANRTSPTGGVGTGAGAAGTPQVRGGFSAGLRESDRQIAGGATGPMRTTTAPRF